ncbi:MAG: hypothetical protein M0R46_13840 [Candidatus Muirbacterium halophilum]|nr:hypothetical protein [Candidatus Muirbacterium halophilum]
MNIEKKYIFNKDGDDKWTMNVEGKPEIFGVIEKEYTKTKSKSVFSIKYYWKKVLQEKAYADTIDEAKSKLIDILGKVQKQVRHMETTFESFLGNNL